MFIINLISLFLFLHRLFRWIAWIQQKEYRLDRLKAWLQTKEGKSELLLPYSGLLQFKRPKLTSRAMLIIMSSMLIIFLYDYLWIWWLITPFIALLVTLMTALPPQLVKQFIIKLAQHKINQAKVSIIGITGSYGKTSTRHLLACFLPSSYTPPKSYNNLFSVALDILQHYQGQKYLVLEYGAYRLGEIAAMAKVFPPQIAILTAIGNQHLALFGSRANLIKAKSELITTLPPHGKIYADLSDPTLSHMLNAHIKQVVDVSHLKSKIQHLSSNFLGTHYHLNIALAMQVALDLGISRDQLIKKLKTFVPPETVIKSYSQHQALIIDDGHTANVDGFKAMIALVNTYPQPHKILLFGGIVDLGTESDISHQQLAELAYHTFSQILYTGEVGKTIFTQVCSNKMIHKLPKLTKDDLVVIEGHLPHGYF